MALSTSFLSVAEKATKFGGFEDAPSVAFVDGAVELDAARVAAVLTTARSAGLLDQKSARISGRISPTLLAQAKRRTGIESDTDLIEFALANVALDDEFADVFRRSRGTVDPDLELGF